MAAHYSVNGVDQSLGIQGFPEEESWAHLLLPSSTLVPVA